MMFVSQTVARRAQLAQEIRALEFEMRHADPYRVQMLVEQVARLRKLTERS
jgi:hypothetical protein